MLRQGVWMAIMLVILSVLTACPHKEIIGSGDSFAPKEGNEERSESLELQDGIAGRWEALEPRIGPVNILEFMVDGKATSSTIARIYNHYSIKNDKVVLTIDIGTSMERTEVNKDEQSKANDQGNGPVVYTFVLANDSLMMTHDGSGEVMHMQRDDQATASDSIVGHWSYKHQNGETARMIFDANGINISRVPLPGVLESYYEVRGDIITARSLDKKHAQSVKYKLEDRQLVLIDGDKITHYVRPSEPR